MIIKIKQYVARVARYQENVDGTIAKVEENIVLKGRRFTEASVWKQIPRDCKLIGHGYQEETYNVDDTALLAFCAEHGVKVINVESAPDVNN